MKREELAVVSYDEDGRVTLSHPQALSELDFIRVFAYHLFDDEQASEIVRYAAEEAAAEAASVQGDASGHG
jgi:uncharacterized protein YqeY